jgi:hypothetical protein
MKAKENNRSAAMMLFYNLYEKYLDKPAQFSNVCCYPSFHSSELSWEIVLRHTFAQSPCYYRPLEVTKYGFGSRLQWKTVHTFIKAFWISINSKWTHWHIQHYRVSLHPFLTAEKQFKIRASLYICTVKLFSCVSINIFCTNVCVH